ncbi:uncharacterized protein FFB14_15787 [Fusarium fujikuroi]|nr:uncharacterized protein FFB14_15787 [Fusarium fujikuroi]
MIKHLASVRRRASYSNKIDPFAFTPVISYTITVYILSSTGAFTMCTWLMIKYTCDCVKPMEFVQCEYAIASGQNIKCKPISKQLGKFSTNYCPGHLVYPDAARKYFSDAPPE